MSDSIRRFVQAPFVALVCAAATWAAPIFVCPIPPVQSGAPDPQAPGEPVQETEHCTATEEASDPRDLYDVRTYLLDVRLDPTAESISGRVGMEARAKQDAVEHIALDLIESYRVRAVHWLPSEPLEHGDKLLGKPLKYRHEGALLHVSLPRKLRPEELFTLAVHYDGKTPKPTIARDGLRHQGVFWGKCADGHPRVDVACQLTYGHTWWPCKNANDHPGDKPDRMLVSLTVPEPLMAVSIGTLLGQEPAEKGWTTWHWRLDAPTPTWAVGFAAAAYKRLDHPVELHGMKEPLQLSFYATAGNEERARAQLETVPGVLQTYVDRFGDYPYPHSKLAIVDSLAWSSSAATLISYGSEYPAAVAKKGAPERRIDPFLAHELAHLWWGQSVSAASWNDAWIHESISTYAMHLLHESLLGRDTAEAILSESKARITSKSRIQSQGDEARCGRVAHTTALWIKGPLVLAQLRHYLGDDAAWFDSLKALQSKGHLGFARTADLAEILKQRTGENWDGYFDAWFASAGLPRLDVHVSVLDGPYLVVRATNEQVRGTPWRVPIDLAWEEGDQERSHRIWLEPGESKHAIECVAVPHKVRLIHLRRLLGRIAVTLPPR